MKSYLVALGLVLAWGVVTGGMEARDVEIASKSEREARERKAQMPPADRVFLSRPPLGCPTWIYKCPPDCKVRTTCAADLTRRQQ